MAGSKIPLVLIGGLALVFAKGKKKRSKKSVGGTVDSGSPKVWVPDGNPDKVWREGLTNEELRAMGWIDANPDFTDDELRAMGWSEADISPLLKWRQDRLSFLTDHVPHSTDLSGETDNYGPDTSEMINATMTFQRDWNVFVGYMQELNPGKVFSEPYTKIEVNGHVWDDAMEARVNKAYGKFVTQLEDQDGWHVEELGDTFYSWGDMIAEIKRRK
jgi:hypothetical protein